MAVARRPFLLESILENELSQEQAQNLWDQEAAKLDAGDNSPADQNLAAVPDDATDFETEQIAAEPEKEPDPYAGM